MGIFVAKFMNQTSEKSIIQFYNKQQQHSSCDSICPTLRWVGG